MTDSKFPDRLKDLCNDYYETYMEDPPMPVSSYTRMNSLLAGTRKPTVDELVAISEAFDVSVNYLLVGDGMFPSLRQLKKKDAFSKKSLMIWQVSRQMNRRMQL